MKFTTILKDPFTSLDVADQLSVTAFYFAIAAVVVMAALWAILKKFSPEKVPAYVKNVKHFAFGAASFFAVSMFTLKVAADVSSGEFKKAVFWSIFEIIATAAVLFLAGFVVKAAKPDFLRTYKFIAAGVMLVSLVVAAVVLALHYKNVKARRRRGFISARSRLSHCWFWPLCLSEKRRVLSPLATWPMLRFPSRLLTRFRTLSF